MKKILFLILVVMLVGAMATSAYSVQQFNQDQRVKSEVVTSQNAKSTTITTDNRLLGYTFCGTDPQRIRIYDSALVYDTAANKLRVVDRTGDNNSVTVHFDYPMDIDNGIVTSMPDYTGMESITLYYE